MALTATASRGFEFDRYIQEDETLLLPGDPGVTYAPGDAVDFTNGVLTLCAAGDSPLYQVVGSESIACPAFSGVGFGLPNLDNGFYPGSIAGDMKAYIPCRPIRPKPGTPVFKCTFKNHHDDTVAAYTASTPSLTLTVDLGDDGDALGSILYVYGGTGAGQWNIAAGYVSSTKVLTLHRPFETALSTDSTIVLLDGATTDTVGIGFGSRINGADEDQLNAADGGDDGEWAPFMDALEVPGLMKNLMIKVVNALEIA